MKTIKSVIKKWLGITDMKSDMDLFHFNYNIHKSNLDEYCKRLRFSVDSILLVEMPKMQKAQEKMSETVYDTIGKIKETIKPYSCKSVKCATPEPVKKDTAVAVKKPARLKK